MAITRKTTDIITTFSSAMNKIYDYDKPKIGALNIRKEPKDLSKTTKRSFNPNYDFLNPETATGRHTAASGLFFQVTGKYVEDRVSLVYNTPSGSASSSN